jgi:diaminopimelate epimerase
MMAANLEISFSKFHGLANDFLVTRFAGLPRALPDLARAICAQHTGVGADGLLVVMSPRNKRHQAPV